MRFKRQVNKNICKTIVESKEWLINIIFRKKKKNNSKKLNIK